MDYSLILSKRFNDSQWVLNGDDYDGLVWLSKDTKPTKAQLESHWESVLSEVIAEQSAKLAKKAELLAKLGITEEDAKLLFS
jgi:hypothetical protein